jgi:hypothetical protein
MEIIMQISKLELEENKMYGYSFYHLEWSDDSKSITVKHSIKSNDLNLNDLTSKYELSQLKEKFKL